MIKSKKKISSKHLLKLWVKYDELSTKEKVKKLSLFDRLIAVFKYGVGDVKFFREPSERVIPVLQKMYYEVKYEELQKEYEQDVKTLENYDFDSRMIDLKEHYRCHPKIIQFCNQKFYNNELVIMTTDQGEDDILKVYKTVKGNHARGKFNQRQIDEIKARVIPELGTDINDDDIGIISPYRAQKAKLTTDLGDRDIDVDTVHKFQGREKDNIIITTVDNEITEFADDPNLLNVAISRAKEKIRLVVSENEANDNTNIGDFIKYIQYNNFEVVEGEVYSVFDLLYKDYTMARLNFLQKTKKVSEFDSENIIYKVIENILERKEFSSLDVFMHQPLNMLIRDLKKLTEDEIKYAMHMSTYTDFLINRKVDKSRLLVIEVDGYAYHKEGTRQAERDRMKDEILRKYDLDILRLSTTGSGEKERIVEALERGKKGEG